MRRRRWAGPVGLGRSRDSNCHPRRPESGTDERGFDLLHPGHVELLKRACRMRPPRGPVLNSDASVRGLRGDKSPMQNEHARSIVMRPASIS